MRLVILLVLLTGPTVYGQTIRGYIDYEKVKVFLPQYEIGKREIEKQSKGSHDSLVKLIDSLLQSVVGEHPTCQKSYSDRAKKEDSLKLIDLEKGVTLFQADTERQLEIREGLSELKLKTIVLKELKQFSADNDLICVLDKKHIFYCNDCTDFTADFLNYYKRTRK